MSGRALTVLLSLMFAVSLAGCADGGNWQTKEITGLMPDLTFHAVGEGGKPVTAEDFRGRVVLLFFGYTHCPDVCPATLTRLTQAAGRLQPPRDLAILFVTVDPARDSRALLDRYAAAFGGNVVGLRMDRAALDRITKRYRVTYGYGEPDAGGNYPVSHSGAVFAFDRAGRARLLIRDRDPLEAVVHDLQGLLAEPGPAG